MLLAKGVDDLRCYEGILECPEIRDAELSYFCAAYHVYAAVQAWVYLSDRKWSFDWPEILKSMLIDTR